MIANPAIPFPAAVPHRLTLNEMRGHGPIAEEPTFTSSLTPSRLALAAVVAVVLAIGAFIWLDPMNLLTPAETSPAAPAFVPSAAPAIFEPPTPVPATKPDEVPIAPAPVVQAPRAPALAVRPRAASIKPDEKTAPPALLTKPDEKTDAIVLEPGDDTKNAPKPVATNVPTPVTE